MNLDLSVDEAVIARLRGRVGPEFSEPARLTSEAFTLYAWAVGQAAIGRAIVSAELDGRLVERVSTPSIDSALVRGLAACR